MLLSFLLTALIFYAIFTVMHRLSRHGGLDPDYVITRESFRPMTNRVRGTTTKMGTSATNTQTHASSALHTAVLSPAQKNTRRVVYAACAASLISAAVLGGTIAAGLLTFVVAVVLAPIAVVHLRARREVKSLNKYHGTDEDASLYLPDDWTL